MSIVDILVCLYFAELRVDPARPDWEERDRFVLSKGHGALALYAVLARAGFFPREELFTFESLGSRLQGHPDCLLTPGVEMSTGSLGQGLSVSIGHALGARMRETEARAYCLLGDGESQEGNVWEAAMAAAKFRLDNLVAIVDWNRLQGGVTAEVMPTLEPFGAKWEAFGWHVVEVDGHDHAALLSALSQARETEGRPTVLLAHTVKGKGVSFM
jgi:transketolase